VSNLILNEQKGQGTYITINRGDVNGLVSDEMAKEIAGMIDAAGKTSKFIVYRSAGPDFCTGRDRGANPYAPSKEALDFRANSETIFGFYDAFRRSAIPIIGAVQGRALGFGCSIAALCDVTIAADDSRYALPEMGHNILPTIAMSALVDRVGRKGIMYLALSTREVDAQTALSYGLVSLVVPKAKLDEEVENVVTAITKAPAPAVLGAKEYLGVALGMDVKSAASYAKNLHATVNTSSRMRETH
jgi:enoyl-CoA hydratase